MSTEEKMRILLGPDWFSELKKGTMQKPHGAGARNEGEQDVPQTEE